MSILICILFYIIANAVAGYRNAKRNHWLVTNYLLTIILFLTELMNLPVFIIVLVVLTSTSFVLIQENIRKKYLTLPIMNWFKRKLPKLSQTEAEALESGDCWMEQSLFQGKPDWKWLDKLEISQPNQEEQAFIDNETTELCQRLDDWKIINEDHDLSPEAWSYLKEKGFCGLTIEKKYGGKAFSAAAVSAIVQKVSSKSFTAGVTTMVPNSLGLGELFSHFGTEEQKQEFLPALAKGEHLACFALTGPQAGSDASNIPDIGTVCYQEFNGKKTLGMSITFAKRYITLAPVATLVGLAFKLRDPEGLLNGIGNEGITCCYVPRNHKGLEIGKRHYPCGMPIMNGPIHGRDVFVPIEWIIGGQKMAGRGWSILISALSIGRAISLPAIAQGITSSQYISTSAYTAIREQFGQSIGEFEGVQAVLARIAGLTYLADATRKLTYTAIDHKIKPAVASAIVKYNNTEICRKIINHALDLHGGRGVMDGPKNYLSGHYRGLLISITGEGANIMTRNLIIYGQAMTRCHPYIAKLMASATENNMNAFDDVLWKNIGFSIHNSLRLLWLSITRARFIAQAPQNQLTKYCKDITLLSSMFSVTSDAAMLTLGGELKQKERISSCLADMLSNLYLSTAVIKKAMHNKLEKTELIHAEWALQYCSFEFQSAFYEYLENLPNRYIAFKLKAVCFPFGKRFKAPSHELENQLAESMQQNSDLRDNIKKQFFDPNTNIGEVENVFQQKIEIKPILDKFRDAVRNKKINKRLIFEEQLEEARQQELISNSEYTALQEYWQNYQNAIAVDAFQKL
jgi:acyl-CoA dehydrogenase